MKASLSFLTIGLILFGALPAAGEFGASRLVFVIDFDDFMCFSCLESFVGFCHSLPERFRREKCLGILAVPPARKNRPVLLQIMRKKLRGFRQANAIDFPVVVDEPAFFSSPERDGSCVLVFQPGELELEMYTFPLSSSARDMILNNIGQFE
jgi:hypothetical protein